MSFDYVLFLQRILDDSYCLKSQCENKDGCRLIIAILALVYVFLTSTKCLLSWGQARTCSLRPIINVKGNMDT